MTLQQARRTSAAALVGVLLVASGGNGGVAAAADATPKRDACSMLTAKAVSAAIGRTVGEGRKTNESGNAKSGSQMSTCTWDVVPSAPATNAAQVMRNHVSAQLILWSWANAKGGVSYLESFRKVAKEMNEPELPRVALGDEAIRDGTSVHVRKGNASFTMAVQVAGDADAQAASKAAEALAKQVVAKL